MSFRVINPGFATFLTPNDNHYSATTVESDVYNPINGVSFYLNSNTFFKAFVNESFDKDIYVVFDLYGTANYLDSLYVGALVNGRTSGANSIYGLRGWDYTLCVHDYGSKKNSISVVKNSVNRVWLHIHNEGTSDDSESYIEIKANDNEVHYTLSTVYDFTSNCKFLFIQSDANIYLSNFIISNEYIDPKEQVIILPTSSIDTDMLNNQDGSFTADQENQYFLQAVDTSDLIAQFGANSKVTGIANIAAPAFKSASGLSNLISIEKNNNQIINHSSCSISDDSLSGVSDCWSTNNLSISDLNGKLFGWKAAL